MKVKYRKYQVQAMSKWMKNDFRGALYWEPGLGKSFVTMQSCIRLLEKDLAKRILIVVPSGLINMWEDDLLKSGLDPDILFVYLPKKGKKDVELLPSKGHKVVLISYSLIFRRPIDNDFDTFICDESHNLKSHKAKAYKTLKKLIKPKDKVLLLSGTPFPNGRIEIFSQLDLIQPGIVGKNITQFRNNYCVCTNKDYYIYDVLPENNKLIDGILHKYCDFRKTSEAVELPPVSYINIPYEMSKKQKKSYNQIKNTKIYKDKAGEEIPLVQPAIRLMLLRQVTSGFVKMNLDYTKELGMKFELNDCLDKEIPKEQTLFDLLNALPQNKQGLIWVAFRETGERLKRYLEKYFKVGLIHGNVNKPDRAKLLKKYQEKKIQFLIAHPLTLGTGINIFQKTQYMIWYELSYDAALYEQAEGRINRLGQDNNMFIYTLLGRQTVDDKVQYAVKNKLDVEKYIFETYLKEEL